LSKLTDTNKEWLLSFVSGKNFYDKRLKNSEATEQIYTMRLKQYSDNVGKNPDELIKLRATQLEFAIMLQKGVNVESINENAAEELLENFLRQDTYFGFDKDGKKEEREFTNDSKNGMLAAIKSFYESTRGRNLAPDVGDFLEKSVPKQRPPTVKDCLELENFMTNDRDKFLVWFLESCAVRKGTLQQLKFRDLKPLNDKELPYWIKVEAKRLKGKGKGKFKKALHIGFLHYYAVEKFEAYKQELNENGIEYNDDSPLFMSYKTTPYGKKGDGLTNLNYMFVDASKDAWGDLKKKRFSPHDFRDVISTALRDKAKVTSNLTKPLTSHTPKDIEAVYEGGLFNTETDAPSEDLIQVVKSIITFLVPRTIPALEVKINEQTAENQKQQTQLEESLKQLALQKETIADNENLLLDVLRNDFKVRLDLTKRDAELAVMKIKAHVIPMEFPEALQKEFKELDDKTIKALTEKLEKLNRIPEDNQTKDELKKSFALVMEAQTATHEALKNLSTKSIKITLKD